MDRETLEQQDGGSELDPNPVKRLRTAEGEATESGGGGGWRGSVDVVGEKQLSWRKHMYVFMCVLLHLLIVKVW